MQSAFFNKLDPQPALKPLQHGAASIYSLDLTQANMKQGLDTLLPWAAGAGFAAQIKEQVVMISLTVVLRCHPCFITHLAWRAL
jgi:hypothetical protein